MSKKLSDYATVGEYARAVSGADEWNAHVERERARLSAVVDAARAASRRDTELALLNVLLVRDVLRVIRDNHGEEYADNLHLSEGREPLGKVSAEIIRLAEGHAAQRLSVIGKYADAAR